ncbi:MAG: DNA polymerase I [Acidobacteriota bacterium]
MGKRLFLIDGSALAYRSYFAFIRNPLINSRGENTSAVFGFTNSLLRLMSKEQPEYLAVVFDSRQPTFRHKAYPAYKATRQKMPEEMIPQMPRIMEVLEAMGLPVLEMPGYEADDIVGSLSKRFAGEGAEVYLVSGDKDLFQLVGPSVKFYHLRSTGKEVDILNDEEVEEKFGVPPGKVVDVLALMGDSSDNIPGVPRVGEKTAIQLVKEFGSLEEVLRRTDEIKRTIIRKSVQENRDLALLSQRLVTLDCDIPLKLSLDELKLKEPERDKLIELFKELEFTSLLQEFSLGQAEEERRCIMIDSLQALQTLIDKLTRADSFALDLETTSANPLQAEMVGFSFAVKEREAFYLSASPPHARIPLKEILSRLKPLLEDERVKKCGQNIKYDMLVLSNYGIELRGVDFDTMVASYLLNPSRRQHNLDIISLEYLNYKKITLQSLIGKGKKQISMREVPLDKVFPYACEDADIALRLRNLLQQKLVETGTWELFTEVEVPLISVLAEMERQGITLDMELLREMSLRLETQLQQIAHNIYILSGEEFNINSTQQLGKILFEKLQIHKELGIRRVKRTKTGYSTNSSVLEAMGEHPLVRNLLEYRQLSKLKSTYVDALPQLVNPRTGRVHTSFNQTITATGRLSSSDPNLQNIPIRSEVGRQIRKAFIPSEKSRLILSADYSQIELRIMAHLSGDDTLVESFKRDEDVHRRTASLIFEVPPEKVTYEMRYKAKSINFGIIYGMGPFRLSREVGISVEDARRFIESYFQKYPKVHQYIVNRLADAKRLGYVTTLLNRRRLLPELHSTNQGVRAAAENIAINTPIQGSAADLIKVAMIRISREMKRRGWQTRMLLQVHDELVFEVPEKELEEVKNYIKKEMEGVYRLSVPIKVAISTGKNWYEAH